LVDLLWVVAFVLLVSFLSNVSPFVGASYTLMATLQLTLLGFTPFNFLAIVVLSAIGATLAKVVIYYGGLGFKDTLLRNKNVRLIGRSSKSEKFYVVLFATALLPVFPFDDFIYIGAGAASASLGLMSLVTLSAKLLKSGVEVALEFTILRDLAAVFGYHQLDLTIALTAAFLIIGILVYQVDWEAAYRRFWKRGAGEEGPRSESPADKPL
jgi:hypothetical protein